MQEISARPEITKKLRDLNCEWKSGRELIEESDALRTLLSKVSRLDWYFGGELSRELGFMRWCMTEKIFDPDASAPGVALASLLKGKQSVVYRFMDSVYVDRARFDALDARVKPYFVLHGLLQSYLAPKSAGRGARLAKLLAAFTKIEAGTLKTRAALHAFLKEAGILFPRTVTKLDPYRTQVEFLLGDENTRATFLEKASVPEALIALPEKTVFPLLSDWDYAVIPTPEAALMNALETVFARDSTDDFEVRLTTGQFRRIAPVQAALDVLDELTASKRAILFAEKVFGPWIAARFGAFSSAKVTFQNGKALASSFLQSLASREAGSATAPVVTLIPRESGSPQMPLPKEAKALVETLALLVNQGEWEQVETRFTDNDAFYSALGLKPALRTLRATAGQEAATQMLERVREGLLAKFFEEVSDKVSPEAYEYLARRITFDRFR